MLKIKPELVLKIDAILGESPRWSEKEKVLYWVDILSCQLHRFDPYSKKNTTDFFDESVTAIGFCSDQKLILALQSGIAFYDLQTQVLEKICEPEKPLPNNRFNEGKCDRQGRFWCGTMNNKGDPFLDSGNLYRFDINHHATLVQNHVKLSNGMGWSPDNKIMYFTETGRHTIFAYDFEPETGNISNRKIFASIEPYPDGGPDGLTVDREGYVWSAYYGKGMIVRYTPQGTIERMIEVPVPKVTSCTFGGTDLKTLFITTAQEHMTEKQIEDFPLSGSLFAYESDIQGLPEGFYRG